MRAVNEAQGIDNGHKDLYSTLIRRYHACTGNMDKEDTIGEFKKEDFPVISCTMALGLAQNWKRVRRVITMGQGDPSCIGQMMGRCGRDGRPGLAILFKEKKRKFGLNSLKAIAKADKEDDNVRMDLSSEQLVSAVPVCLRIAFSVDNLYGYIPMDRDDPNYLREEICEEAEGFSGTPEEAELLLECMKITTVNNFGSILDHPKHFPNTDAARTSKKRPQEVERPVIVVPIQCLTGLQAHLSRTSMCSSDFGTRRRHPSYRLKFFLAWRPTQSPTVWILSKTGAMLRTSLGGKQWTERLKCCINV
ncbi:hypothetical protein Pst134EA_016008 [Puccinia striiformis f. sp. tritici]|uniref:hypothetical protein n=1 Tax=Puccinia striiformis f. sp. tritici TaxID=168172 RepID=UPI0020072AEB|nr:hypothetical protein Pst134EA_016008 [Puccinia striiformis f. sp. tritici]KAH9463928.1 hypothetical protein Pst134EA_016008 [Puccinia striiformis f. sp. tritici]